MVKSRRKGAAFEREIARDLRGWLGEPWTVARLRTDEQQGDEHAGEFAVKGGPFRFPFAVECKTHKAFSLVQLWRKPVAGPFGSWWTQAVQQAEGARLLPMLVVRVPFGPRLVVLRRATAAAINALHVPGMHVHLEDGTHGGENLRVLLWDDLVRCDPSWLREALKW